MTSSNCVKSALAALLFVSVINAKKPEAEIPTFTSDFTGCVETIGIGLVSTSLAMAMVPPDIHLPGEGDAVTPLVVRTANCDEITVDKARSKSGSIVQIGLLMFPRDSSAFLDIYTLLFYTTEPKLAHALKKFGVDAQHVPTIDYNISGWQFSVSVRRPGDPAVQVTGQIVPWTSPNGVFVSNWWQDVKGGIVRMNTTMPDLATSDANLILTTDPNSKLGRLIGGKSMGFPLLQQYNTFDGAHMDTHSLP